MNEQNNYCAVQGRYPKCYLCTQYQGALSCNLICNGESAFETLESVTVTNTNETITILATDPLFVPISENQLEPIPEPDLSQTIEGKVNEVKAELAKLGEILLEELQQLKQFIFEKLEIKE